MTQVRLETASRLKPIHANHYVLATGGIFGGGLLADQDGRVTEPIFGLPVVADTNRHHWFEKQFISLTGQPVFNFGVKVNPNLNPVNGSHSCGRKSICSRRHHCRLGMDPRPHRRRHRPGDSRRGSRTDWLEEPAELRCH